MNSRFDGIAEFVAVVRLGSFTAVAAEMGMAKSAIGRAVSRLEARLGSKLLHRTTRRLTLTPAGEAWPEHCVAALDELERGESALALARDTPGGEVRIDLPTAFGRLHVMPVLLGVAKRYPALNLNVSFTDRRVDLIGENIDLAVRIGNLEDSTDLVARQIGVQQTVIVGAPGYLARRGVPRSWSDLAGHDCIVGRRQGNRIAWLMKQPDGSTARQAVPVKHELQDFETVLMAAKGGHGLTQLPSWMVEGDLQEGTLQIVLDGLSGGELPISVLWPQTKALPAKIRVTIDGLVQWSLVSTSVAA
ncbi:MULTISPECIES: LysR family transcriptional regulator [unclassified Mesorhizobium]|uniref:LysR family transcriptional regulator n=1 Tax=unclassified Mesorhizobium TaxID=325217 RepID=UPI00112C721F|nr:MULTISPECIES: LysR family transcriptional regulator [unclassified Mesorhizobium]MCA0023944.1 LysR family transcriptional regulator [Mesorhizobium sp. B263B1A]TPJ94511.1 LysR family transcriptional regulator [Mesorhizobium sp. B2-5-12]TPK23210.1 LysR family transcriptional regulator [Mesorhizobium sp. B2-5-6]TPN38973.1 LysR family transcriptional regulator [Mesorhizobium sp. B1-1-6]